MRKNRYSQFIAFAFAVGFVSFSPAVFAQDSRNLSLEEAIQLSLQNNKQLKLSNAKVKEATASLHEAKDNRLPDLKASGSFLRINNPTIDLKVKLGSGSGGPPPTVNQVTYGMISASLPLFSGLRIHCGIESAKYLEQASKLDAENDREEVIQNTIAAYSNLYKANEAVEMMKQNLRESKQRVEDFTNLEKNGLLARNDLLKAELQQSNIELSLLDAENNQNITYINMNLMLGLPERTALVADSSGFQNLSDAGTAIDWEQQAFQNRRDMASLSARARAANMNIKATKGEYFPGLALSGGYIALDVPNFITVTNALNGGIGLQYSISSLWKTPAKVAQARARFEEVEANKDILADAIRIQVNQAYENYLSSQKKIIVYAKAVEQAEENYRITKNKYTNNLATTTDLLDADVAQLQARLNYTFSKADALVTYKKLQQAAGVLNNNQKK